MIQGNVTSVELCRQPISVKTTETEYHAKS